MLLSLYSLFPLSETVRHWWDCTKYWDQEQHVLKITHFLRFSVSPYSKMQTV